MLAHALRMTPLLSVLCVCSLLWTIACSRAPLSPPCPSTPLCAALAVASRLRCSLVVDCGGNWLACASHHALLPRTNGRQIEPDKCDLRHCVYERRHSIAKYDV